MKPLTLDRMAPPRRLTKPQQAERVYVRQLKRLAEHVGHIIGGFPPGDPATVPTITQMLSAYADALMPWATATAKRMVEDVNQRDLVGWKTASAELSKGLQREIQSADVGATMRRLMAEQVTLIRSIPIGAAQRVHDLTIKGLEDSSRAKEVAAEIMRSGEVTVSRAVMIARTETSRTAETLTEARALHVGSTHYIWHTSGDSTVRPDHKILDGKIFAWNDPPVADQHSGARANPGRIYNCRCFSEPIISE